MCETSAGCLSIIGNSWVESNMDPLRDVRTVYLEDQEKTL